MITAGRRLKQIDRGYLRRFGVALVIAVAVHAAAAIGYPHRASFFPLPHTIGYQGPMQVYPKLSVRRPEIAEREQRAAPLAPSGQAFRVENLDYGYLTARTGEEVERRAVPPAPREIRMSPDDDLAFALRSASLPEVTVPEDYLVHLEKPIYPEDALNKGIEGRIVLRALVGSDGTVLRVTVEESHVSRSMEQAAIDAVYKCRFRSYTQNGKPTAFWARFPILFHIVG